MKLDPPKSSCTTYFSFVTIVALPQVLAWLGGTGSVEHLAQAALFAGLAYWAIHWLWWVAAVLLAIPPRPPH